MNIDNNPEKMHKLEKGEENSSPLSLGNIYKNIKIPIKTLDFIILGLVIILFVVLSYTIKNNGFIVEFDSCGGSDIGPQKVYYGDNIEYSIPSREGYDFVGWYRDLGCTSEFNKDDTVSDSIKLYACWIKN